MYTIDGADALVNRR